MCALVRNGCPWFTATSRIFYREHKSIERVAAPST